MLRIITAIMLILNIVVLSNEPDSLCVVPTTQELQDISGTYSSPLSGNLNVVFIEFTFPDYGSTMREYNSTTEYKFQGTYPDGSSIQDDIDNNGNIKVAWLLKDATIDYFETMSHGNVNVNFDIPRNTNRADSMWRTDNNYSSSTTRLVEVLRKVYAEFPAMIDNAGYLAFYSKDYGGNISSIYTMIGEFKLANGTTIFNGPFCFGNLGNQHRAAVITHEIAHRIEYSIDRNKPTLTFPDRGLEDWIRPSIQNPSGSGFVKVKILDSPYDLMYHNDPSNSHLALYGQRPMISFDLMRLGWISSDEILEIDSDQIDILKNIRLYDMRKELTAQQRDDNSNERGYRIVKVYLKKDYYSTRDEYYLIEYHKGTDYDSEFSNYDEDPAIGVLIWHIVESESARNPGIDILCAVPFNGFNHDSGTGFGAPLPNDSYPKTWTTYSYESNFTGIQKNNEYDWLNDLVLNVPRNVVDGWGNPTNGGRQLYELTQVDGANWRRELSKNDDFFTNVPNKGHVNNKLISTTRPSSRDWWGTHTNIGLTNIRTISGTDSYMMIDYYNNYWEGNITENMTMSGNPIIGGNLIVANGVTLTIESNVTIPSGITLTIEEGATISFENNSSLLVSGTITAIGTASNRITFTSSGNWDGITIQSPGTATLKYCEIENASYGITVYNSDPYIEQCYIHDNSYGVTIVNTSSPVFYWNTISDNTYGIKSVSGATPYFGEEHTPPGTAKHGYNVIVDNNYGIYAYDTSTIFLGKDISAQIVGGLNTIYNNSTDDIHVFSNTTVWAEWNWWNGTPSIYTSGSSNVYRTNNYPTNPYGGSVLAKSTGETEDDSEPFDPKNMDMKNPKDLFHLAQHYKYIGNREKAVELFNMVLDDFPNSSYSGQSLIHLYDISRRGGKVDIEAICKSKIGENEKSISQKKTSLDILAAKYMREGKLNDAEKMCKRTLALYPTTGNEKYALFNMFLIKSQSLVDSKDANQYKTTLEEKYPNDFITLLAKSQAGEEVDWSLAKEMGGKDNEETLSNIIPTEFALASAYPNPFNPQTTIQYSLPTDGIVTLSVYTILGEEVATLVNKNQTAGIYTAKFDGADLSSGIYIYRLQVHTPSGEGSFVDSKKMILLK